MSNTSHGRIGSGKNARLGSGKPSAANSIEDPQIYELSLNNPKKTAKPAKLKPLTSKSTNLAISLLEDDKSKPSYLEGVPTSAELDAEIKSYLDTNQIFKQLKTAFDPTAPMTTSLSLDDGEKVVANTAERKKRGSKATLEPIQEEMN
jgi:hypothetical protein